ncbi:MAG: hypothetical protein IBX55_12145 [Methyloprofundus sp.]|nr:hypothetical protein [Methyloprofundus sp.]
MKYFAYLLAFFSVSVMAEPLTVQVHTDAGKHQAVVDIPLGGQEAPFKLEFQNHKYESITVEFNAKGFDNSLITYNGSIRAATHPEHRNVSGVKLPSRDVIFFGFSGSMNENASREVAGFSQWEAEKNQITNEIRVTFSR